MAHYLLAFTNSVPRDVRTLSEQARDLFGARLWGISETAQLRNRLEAGDEVVAYAGALGDRARGPLRRLPPLDFDRTW